MHELLRDVRRKLEKADSLKYIFDRGGLITLPNLEQIPDQQNTPFLILIDTGTPLIRHLSSNTIWREFALKIHSVQRIFKRGDPVLGTPFARGLEEISRDIWNVLHNDRFGGKYAHAQLVGEDEPSPVDETKNMHLQEKAITVRYVRNEGLNC